MAASGESPWIPVAEYRRNITSVIQKHSSRGVPYTNEGMAIRGNRLFLLPEDSLSRLFEYRLPEPVEPG
jgi:hypothetical protein